MEWYAAVPRQGQWPTGFNTKVTSYPLVDKNILTRKKQPRFKLPPFRSPRKKIVHGNAVSS